MYEGLIEVLVFFAQSLVVFLTLAGLILLIAAIASKKAHRQGLQIEDLNEHFQSLREGVLPLLKTKKELKVLQKSMEAQKKDWAQRKDKPTLFVLNYKGDIKASANWGLREEVSAILEVASIKDEVLVKLESPGGMVAPYGLAAAQLARIRSANIPLTVAVDEVAASGGYMMAAVGDKIVASPFALIGSIGVAAPMPNVHKLLKRFDIDYKDYTAGEYKRTLGIFSEPTEKGEQKLIEQLEAIHTQFKNHIQKFRPKLELSRVATGEVWLGAEALTLGLVDEIMTSDELIQKRIAQGYHALKLHFEKPKTLKEKISQATQSSIQGGVEKAIEKSFELLSKRNFF